MTHATFSDTDLTATSIATLKTIAAELGITPEGNKSFKKTWVDAITAHRDAISAQIADQAANVVAVVLEAESMAGSESIAATIEEVVIEHGTTVVEVATSPRAVSAYRFILRAAVFVLVVACKGIYSAGKATRRAWDVAWGLACDLNTEFAILPRVAIEVVKVLRQIKASRSGEDLATVFGPYRAKAAKAGDAAMVMAWAAMTGLALVYDRVVSI